MKKEIIIIHGGHVYDIRDNFLVRLKERKVDREDFKTKKGWKNDFEEKLGKRFEIFTPKMPNKENAKYAEWKIWFEKLIPFLNDDAALIGHSLGGLFLIKYLSESLFPKKIKALILIAAPYSGKNNKYNLDTDFLLNDNDLDGVTNQVNNFYIFHSTDDKVVPFTDFEIYKKKLPGAISASFNNRGHFNTENFPELIRVVKTIYS